MIGKHRAHDLKRNSLDRKEYLNAKNNAIILLDEPP